jgi:uncharacterized membrane protein YdbT with pleckstrin-like domain
MKYVDRVLQPGEVVRAIGRLHWVVYVRGTFLLLIGGCLWQMPLLEGPLGLLWDIAAFVIVAFGLWSLAHAWVEAWTTEIAVTDRRVIRKRGLIRRETAEMNMTRVESVVVDQSVFGRMLGYGSIVVRGTGAGLEGLHYLANPLSLRNAIVSR